MPREHYSRQREFHLRLLDDLVSNYGDVAANSYLPATIEKKEIQCFETGGECDRGVSTGVAPAPSKPAHQW